MLHASDPPQGGETFARRGARDARRRGGRRALAQAALIVVLALLTSCTAQRSTTPGLDPHARSATEPSGPCEVKALAVPSCGVLLGIATRTPTVETVRSVEAQLGRRVNFVYRYHDLNDLVPTDDERELVAQGRLLHISIASRDFARTDGSVISWREVASGAFDSALRRQARGVASLKAPVYVTFEQEASQQRKVDQLGSPADFVAAWRHVHELYREMGVRNAVWVWVMTGGSETLSNLARMWPGNDQVDWISWNVYNQSGCKSGHITPEKHVSFDYKLQVVYRFLEDYAPQLGIDISKPMMISETGSAQYADDLARTAEWYRSIPSVLHGLPNVKALTLWDSTDRRTPDCDYRFSRSAQVTAAVKEMSGDPLFSVR